VRLYISMLKIMIQNTATSVTIKGQEDENAILNVSPMLKI